MVGYETTFISSAELSDDSIRSFVEKLNGIIQAHGGQLVATEDWGRRRMAYPIRKETRGAYTYLLYTGNSSLVAEIERNLRINEHVLRFLSVKLGDDFDPAKYKRGVTPASHVAVPLVVGHPHGAQPSA